MGTQQTVMPLKEFAEFNAEHAVHRLFFVTDQCTSMPASAWRW